MSNFFAIHLIRWIMITIGLGFIIFVLIKYMSRLKKNKINSYIFQDVHVIVGDGTERFHQNVYVKDGIIQKITTERIENVKAIIIDAKDMTLMPGLIDSHAHIQGMNNKSDKESNAFLYGMLPEIFRDKVLPFGITTVKDLCAPRHFIYKLRDEIKSGKIVGPELLLVGPNFTAPEGHPASTLGGDNPWMRNEMAIEVNSTKQVSDSIRELKTAGVDFLKITYQGGDYLYFNETLQIAKIEKKYMEQIIREGKENGLYTTAHVYYKEDVRELLEAGIYGIEHGVLDEKLSSDDDLVKLWKRSGAHFVPTVNAMNYEKDPNRLVNSIHNLKVLYDAGIPIAMGTDTMYEMMSGEFTHKEIAYYVEAGLSPMEAIVLATGNSAKHLGIDNRKGYIKEGFEADLILLGKNPAEDISNLDLIDKVFLKGNIVYSQKSIQSYDIPEYSYPPEISYMEYQKSDGTEVRKIYTDAYINEKKIIQDVYHGNDLWSHEIFHVEKNLSCTKWQYERPSDDTRVFAIKTGEFIQISGTFKGKKQDKTYKIGSGLWYQMMDIALPAFIASKEQEIIFYSLGTENNMGAMGLGEFAAKKAGNEKIIVNNRAYECVKISYVITAFSWAWTGYLWYDVKTNQLVKTSEKGKNADKEHRVLTKISRNPMEHND